MIPISIEWLPVSAMSSEQIAEVTDLVNRANRAYPRVFTMDRLGEGDLVAQYGDNTIALALSSDRIVGTFNYRTDESKFMLLLLAVHPDAQGKRLGDSLVKTACARASELSCKCVEIDVVDFGRLTAFYERLGFVETSRKTLPAGYWTATEPFELVTMQKPT